MLKAVLIPLRLFVLGLYIVSPGYGIMVFFTFIAFWVPTTVAFYTAHVVNFFRDDNNCEAVNPTVYAALILILIEAIAVLFAVTTSMFVLAVLIPFLAVQGCRKVKHEKHDAKIAHSGEKSVTHAAL